MFVLTPCRARGLRSPPRVPAPAKRLGGQAASAWVRASCASGGRWGFAGRCPAWQTASSSGAACSSLWSLLLQRRHGGRPGRCTFRPLRFFHAWAGGTFSWRGSVFFYGESRICSFDAPCCPSGTPSGLAAHSHNAVLRVCIPLAPACLRLSSSISSLGSSLRGGYLGPIPRWKLLLVVLAVTLANKHVPAYLLGLVLVDLSSRLGCFQIPFPTTSGLRWSVLKPYLLTRLAACLGPSPALCTLLVAPKAHYSQLRASSRYIVVRIHLPPASDSPRLRGAFVFVVSMACILRIQGSRACALDP